jgi:hypothetical protein
MSLEAQIAVAVIGGIVTVVAAIIAARAARSARRENRQERLEARLSRAEHDNRLMWLWCRQLVDHIYRGGTPPPPPAPAGLFEDTTPPKGTP